MGLRPLPEQALTLGTDQPHEGKPRQDSDQRLHAQRQWLLLVYFVSDLCLVQRYKYCAMLPREGSTAASSKTKPIGIDVLLTELVV